MGKKLFGTLYLVQQNTVRPALDVHSEILKYACSHGSPALPRCIQGLQFGVGVQSRLFSRLVEMYVQVLRSFSHIENTGS